MQGIRPPGPKRADPAPSGLPPTLALTAQLVAGLAAAAALVALAAATGQRGVLVPSMLPVMFLLAGAVGGRARPDHPGLRLLTAVGTAHLSSFALSGWLGAAAGAGPSAPSGWGLWLGALLAEALFLLGFVALALLVACYPSGQVRTRGQRALRACAGAAVVLALLVQALLRGELEPVLDTEARAIPAPPPLPLVDLPVSGIVPVLLVVVAAPLVLVFAARSLGSEERAALGWGKLAGALVALVLVTTPLASMLFASWVWNLVSLLALAAVPFLLLAGLVRYHLLEVDLYVVRTMSRGLVLVLVLLAYAALAVSGRDAGFVGPVLVTVLAALTGVPLLRRLEDLADRWATGGRVARARVEDHLGLVLATEVADAMPERLVVSLGEGLDAAWVRLTAGDRMLAGPAGPDPAVSVDLRVAGKSIGRLDCGPRRGGWGAPEAALLDRLAGPVAAAVHGVELTHQLADRVEELSAARSRLIEAEESARRRMERDLHDGVQQQLVALLTRIALVRAQLERSAVEAGPAVEGSLAEAHGLARTVLADLRALVSGIHPHLLGERGLAAAVEARVSSLPLAVTVDVDPRIASRRFEPAVEGAAYFVVSEAVANVMKHAAGSEVRVLIGPVEPDGLRVAVTDGGSGGATDAGSGLRGLRDRVEALNGRFLVHSLEGVGTTVVAEFPAPTPAPTPVPAAVTRA
jgi:signal transduction histidine kinase